MKGRNAEELLNRLDAKRSTQELVLVFGLPEIEELAGQLGAGGRDTARLLLTCAREARMQVRRKEG